MKKQIKGKKLISAKKAELRAVRRRYLREVSMFIRKVSTTYNLAASEGWDSLNAIHNIRKIEELSLYLVDPNPMVREYAELKATYFNKISKLEKRILNKIKKLEKL